MRAAMFTDQCGQRVFINAGAVFGVTHINGCTEITSLGGHVWRVTESLDEVVARLGWHVTTISMGDPMNSAHGGRERSGT